MIDLNTYKKLKQALESEEFNKIISKIDDKVRRRSILKEALCFLITTRDYDNLIPYLSNYNQEIFPYRYFCDKSLDRNQTNEIIFNNYIKNGFLFHVTPQKNQDNILTNGLLSLNDHYHCDFYQKSQDINKIYLNIKARNNNSSMFLKNSLFNIPQEEFTSSRCSSVYLSSDLEYILRLYGNSGEFAYLFIYDLVMAFNLNNNNVKKLTPQNIKEEFLKSIHKHNLNIYEEELNQLISFFNLIYEESPNYMVAERSLVLTPTSNIKSNSYAWKYYKEFSKKITPEEIIDINFGEIISECSIPPEDIITISDNPNKTLSLKKKE